MDLDEDEYLVNREAYRDKEFLNRYIKNPKEELQKIKTREYKDTMLLRLSNLVLKEINLLKETSNNKEEMLEKANVLFNLNKFISNYDELEPVLIKFFAEKNRKEKFEER
jgi:hypothetical protein